MADFETKCEQHALDYIKIHLREGYYVTAYIDKGTYYWEKVYKVHVCKATDTSRTDCFDTCKHAYSEVCDECYESNKYNAMKGEDDE